MADAERRSLCLVDDIHFIIDFRIRHSRRQMAGKGHRLATGRHLSRYSSRSAARPRRLCAFQGLSADRSVAVRQRIAGNLNSGPRLRVQLTSGRRPADPPRRPASLANTSSLHDRPGSAPAAWSSRVVSAHGTSDLARRADEFDAVRCTRSNGRGIA